jgi:nucleoside-diphosphate-sugar epimerase
LDTRFYQGRDFGPNPIIVTGLKKDVRDVEPSDVSGFDAVIHLAALSNDPLGFLDERCTYAINHQGTIAMARAAKRAGVERFLFASSCSLYGAAGDALLDETAAFNPITAYGTSKVLAESDLAAMADDSFSPTFLRNATAYGVSPRLRADVVVNNLVGAACTKGEVLIQSDGTPWRPLVHVDDIAGAFLAVLEAPRDAVHNQAFNVGSTMENYQVRDIAEMVRDVVPGCTIRYLDGGGPDPRCYRVNCDKIVRHLGFKTQWTVRQGIEQLHAAFVREELTDEQFSRYVRLECIQTLVQERQLDATLRWRTAATASADDTHGGLVRQGGR